MKWNAVPWIFRKRETLGAKRWGRHFLCYCLSNRNRNRNTQTVSVRVPVCQSLPWQFPNLSWSHLYQSFLVLLRMRIKIWEWNARFKEQQNNHFWRNTSVFRAQFRDTNAEWNVIMHTDWASKSQRFHLFVLFWLEFHLAVVFWKWILKCK